MNERLQQNLERARSNLLEAQEWLHLGRTSAKPIPTFVLRNREKVVLHYLDRVWEAQCMANGVGWGK